MLDIGFSELLLIAVVALVVIGPKDLPVVMRHAMKFFREIGAVYAGLKTQMQQVVEETGVQDLKQRMHTIIDLEGKPQQAYDVSELETLIAPSRGGARREEALSTARVLPAAPPPQPSPEKSEEA